MINYLDEVISILEISIEVGVAVLVGVELSGATSVRKGRTSAHIHSPSRLSFLEASHSLIAIVFFSAPTFVKLIAAFLTGDPFVVSEIVRLPS